MPDITLTFDNGPTPGVTDKVLSVLSRYGISTTFFVVGSRVAEPGGRELMERAHDEGHWIGNHTWSHPTPFGQWPDAQDPATEILSTQRLIGGHSHPDRLFRPTGGGGFLDRRLLDRRALDFLRAQSMTLVLWNAIPRDWADPDGWVGTACRQFVGAQWSLMVLHDTDTSAMDGLPRFIDAVLEAGGRFRQDFPPECVPIRRGEIVAPVDRYLTVYESEETTR